MTRKDIIRMALEAGIVRFGPSTQLTIEQIDCFAALVAAAEREECAKVCEEVVIDNPGRADLTADQCAAAIRARGEK